jgi:hypothetical protein
VNQVFTTKECNALHSERVRFGCSPSRLLQHQLAAGGQRHETSLLLQGRTNAQQAARTARVAGGQIFAADAIVATTGVGLGRVGGGRVGPWGRVARACVQGWGPHPPRGSGIAWRKECAWCESAGTSVRSGGPSSSREAPLLPLPLILKRLAAVPAAAADADLVATFKFNSDLD